MAIATRKMVPGQSVSARSVLRYPGGKTRAVPELEKCLPEGLEEMVSPFFGGGSFEFACAHRGIRVHGSDIFQPLTNFWQQLFADAAALAERVAAYHPLSHAKFYSLQKRYPLLVDPLEQAAVFFVLNRSSYSGTTLSGGMSPEHPRFTESAIERLRNFRAPRVSVDELDFEAAFAKYPDAYLYLDPPYLNGQSLYGQKGNAHDDFDHERLCELLHQRRSAWLLSYNDSPQIREMYADFHIMTPVWSYGMGNVKSDRMKRSSELIISSH